MAKLELLTLVGGYVGLEEKEEGHVRIGLEKAEVFFCYLVLLGLLVYF